MLVKYGGNVAWNTSDGIEYAFAFNNGVLTLSYNTGGGSPSTVVDPTTRSAGQWYHLAVATDASNNIALFVNGTRVATGSNAITKPTTRTSIEIGATSSQFLNGYLSDARFVIGAEAIDPTSTSITLPTAPLTDVSNTELLCNFTNAGIYDGTGRNVLETVGDAHVENSVKKYGTGSMQFDGTTGYLEAPASRLFDFGDGDFTIEFWMYNQSDSDDRGGIFELYVNDNNYLRLFRQTGNQLEVQVSNAGSRNVDISTSITEDQWTHIALVVNNGTMTVYKDGTSVGSDGLFTLPDLSSAQVLVGLDLLNTARWYTGYIDDLRVTKGVARYTANFTPPAAKLPNL